MGKRELLLIGGFVLAGVLVYFVTAPASTPDQTGFSVGKVIDEIRRELRGNHARAEVKSSATRPLRSEVTEIRFEFLKSAPLTVVGEAREDILYDLQVVSTGADETEARRYAGETQLKFVEAGTTLIVSLEYPQPAEQRAVLSVRVPSRLAVRVQPNRAKIDVSDMASVEIADARGQVTVRGVSGRLAVTHRGGDLTVENVSSAKLNTRGSVVVLRDVKGEVTVQMQSGELRGTAIAGPLELDSNGGQIVLEDLGSTKRAVRINAVGGSVTLAGVSADLRVEARDARVEVAIEKPAPMFINTEGDEPMLVTLPAGGFNLDALAMHSRLIVSQDLPEVKVSETDQRAAGPVAGGGPTITLRSSRGELTLKKKSAT
jgi:hypothetical protein